MFSTIHHVAVHCTDLGRSVAFYTDCFGFDVTFRRDRPDGGGIAFMRLGGMVLELTQRANRKDDHISGMHFAIAVDDMEAVLTHMKAKGVEMTLAPVAKDNPYPHYHAEFAGPDGEQIEIMAPRATCDRMESPDHE